MGIRKLKPTSPGQRHKIIGAFDKITASTPEKSLVVGKKRTGGRNNTGKMTMRYIGGGHKRRFRFIDFKRSKDGIPATVKSIEYDPNRTSRIALLYYADGEKSYIVAPNGLEVGQTVMSGKDATPEVGNALPMQSIPVGTIIHNIELRPGQGAKLVRSAGAFAQLTSKEGDYAIIKMPSGETRKILLACKATVGSVDNSDHARDRFRIVFIYLTSESRNVKACHIYSLLGLLFISISIAFVGCMRPDRHSCMLNVIGISTPMRSASDAAASHV